MHQIVVFNQAYFMKTKALRRKRIPGGNVLRSWKTTPPCDLLPPSALLEIAGCSTSANSFHASLTLSSQLPQQWLRSTLSLTETPSSSYVSCDFESSTSSNCAHYQIECDWNALAMAAVEWHTDGLQPNRQSSLKVTSFTLGLFRPYSFHNDYSMSLTIHFGAQHLSCVLIFRLFTFKRLCSFDCP